MENRNEDLWGIRTKAIIFLGEDIEKTEKSRKRRQGRWGGVKKSSLRIFLVFVSSGTRQLSLSSRSYTTHSPFFFCEPCFFYVPHFMCGFSFYFWRGVLHYEGI